MDYYKEVFQYFINIIKLRPEGQITDNLHYLKKKTAKYYKHYLFTKQLNYDLRKIIEL